MSLSIGRIVHYVLKNGANAGQVRPAMVVRAWNETSAQLKVFLDEANDHGAETFASSSSLSGDNKAPGSWFWPPRVADVAKTVATLLLGLALLVALAPTHALAQAAAPAAPTPTIGQQLLGLLGSSGGIATIVTLVGGVLAMAFGSNVVLKRRIALAAYHAFHVTEDIANEDTSENGIDKAAVALKQIDAYFAANGWRPMKPGDVELAKLQLQSLSGQEVQAKKLAAIAGEAAGHPQTPPAS